MGKRTLVFVDDSNLHVMAQRLGRSVDYADLWMFLEEGRNLIEVFVYISLPPTTPDWEQDRKAKSSYAKQIGKLGFNIVTIEGIPMSTGKREFKAGTDVTMAVDVMQLANDIKPEVVILVTGDSDFAHLARTLRRHGVRVEVASTPKALSYQLQEAANYTIDLTQFFGGSFPSAGKGSFRVHGNGKNQTVAIDTTA